ncbi:MAG: oligosaccharide flippase family protein [Candidatus Micrarchaeota archaeon]
MLNQKFFVIIFFLLVASILTAQIMWKNSISSELALIPYLLFIPLFFIKKIDGRWFIVGALGFLILSGLILILKNSEKLANLSAIHAYYSLTAGVILMIIEMITKRTDKELYFIEWKDIKFKTPTVHFNRIPRMQKVHYSSGKKISVPKIQLNLILNAFNFLADWFWELAIFTSVMFGGLLFLILKKFDEPIYFIGIERELAPFLIGSLLLTLIAGYLRYKDHLKQNKNYDLMKNAGFFSFANIIGNAFNFIFHFYVARFITITEYGVLNALIAAISLFLLPIGSFSALIVKQIAKEDNKEKISGIAKATIKTAILLSLFIMAVLFIAKEPLQDYFHITDDLIIFLFVINVGLLLISNTLNGILQGLQRFFISGSVFIFSSGVKLAIMFYLVAIVSLGLVGAVTAYAVIPLVTIVLIFYFVHSFLLQKSESFNIFKLKREYLAIVAIDIGLFLALSGDLLVLGNLFPNDDLGFYAAASVIAKILTFALLPFANVAFPKIVSQIKTGSEKATFWLTLTGVLLGGLVFLAVYYILGHHIISFVYSTKYTEAMQFLLILTVSAIFYTANMVISRYMIAHEKRAYSIFAFLIPIIGLVSIYILLPAIQDVPFFMLGINLLLAIIGLIFVTKK